MKTEGKIRKEILDKVVEFYKAEKPSQFIPGRTYINYAGRVYDSKELINLVDASLDFWLTTGRYSEEFEKKLAAFIGTKFCLLTNSGSSANLLAVTALTSPLLGDKQLRPGDEIITVACGFPTTLNPLIQNNLVPVFIDVELGTYNINVRQIERAVTDKTKAIFISHTMGNPAAIDVILKIAGKYDLWFIEDNCDSLGSEFKGRRTGSFGDISTCSFYPAHHITMGEGGAVLTNDPVLRRIIMSFRDWGRDCWCGPGRDNTCQKRFSRKFAGLPYGYDHKYVYSHIGYNLKATDMQAAIGVAQLAKLPAFIKARRNNFNYLFGYFKKYEEYFILPRWDKKSDPAWFGFPLLVREDAPFTRNELVSWFERNKVATRMLFGGNLVKQPAYKNIKCRFFKELDNTDLVMKNLFWIGVYPGLNDSMLKYISGLTEQFLTKTG